MNLIFVLIFSVVTICSAQNEKEIEPRLIGSTGNDDLPKSTVALFVKLTPNSAICSGAFFHFKWIITAASCVHQYTAGELRFKYGGIIPDGDPNHFGDGYRLDEMFVHPNFIQSTRVNDIALLKTLETFNIEPYVITRVNQVSPGTSVILRGYGPQNLDVDDPITQNLRQGKTVLSKYMDCRKYDASLTPNKLCSIGRGRVCSGDQGGPLLLRGGLDLIGIISVSPEVEYLCGFGLKPLESYTNVFLYRKWITDISKVIV